MAREYGSGTWRYVNITLSGTTLKYVFPSKLKDSLKNDFGQIDITKQFNIQNAVVTPRRPKPPRASKRLPDGHEGSYCSSSKTKDLRADGYTIKRAQLGTFNQTNLSRVLYVEYNGIKYAWKRPRSVGSSVLVTPVGAKDASNERDLVFGADFPKPPKAVVEIPGQGSYRCFVDQSKVASAELDQSAQSAGWSLINSGITELDDLLTMVKVSE